MDVSWPLTYTPLLTLAIGCYCLAVVCRHVGRRALFGYRRQSIGNRLGLRQSLNITIGVSEGCAGIRHIRYY